MDHLDLPRRRSAHRRVCIVVPGMNEQRPGADRVSCPSRSHQRVFQQRRSNALCHGGTRRPQGARVGSPGLGAGPDPSSRAPSPHHESVLAADAERHVCQPRGQDSVIACAIEMPALLQTHQEVEIRSPLTEPAVSAITTTGGGTAITPAASR